MEWRSGNIGRRTAGKWRRFYDTVHEVNAADYTNEQLDTLADGKVDTAAWNRSFLEHDTFVAEENGVIVGFADMDAGPDIWTGSMYIRIIRKRGLPAPL